MSDLGFINVASASVNQVFTFQLNTPGLIHSPTLAQSFQGASDRMVLNNLSGCTFKCTLQPSGRSFTVPPAVPTDPIPLTVRGSSDDSFTLSVDAISSGTFANQVHVDWFAAGEDVLGASSSGSAIGTGNSVASLTVTGHDTWNILEDLVGNLLLQDTTTNVAFKFGRDTHPNYSAVSGFLPTLGALQSGISAQTVSGRDAGGLLSVTTTVSPPTAGSTICLVTFASTWNAAPMMFLQPVFSNAIGITNVSTTGFSLVALSNLTASQQFFIYYLAILFQ